MLSLLKYLGKLINKHTPLPLKVQQYHPVSSYYPKSDIKVLFIHGMWHGSWYWKAYQQLLADKGISSYAVDLQGSATDMNRKNSEICSDISATLDQLNLKNVVILGHSQGGIITQYFLKTVLPSRPKGEIIGSCLMGTIPLGMMPPAIKLCQQIRYDGKRAAMYFDIAYLYFLITGRVMNSQYARKIFCITDGQTKLPGTTETTVMEGGGPGSMEKYLDKLVKAPADGNITFTHFLPFQSKSVVNNIPVLVLSAAEDIIYPHTLLQSEFQERYPKSDHVIVKGQAHCFVDPGWENGVIEPLTKWVESLKKDVNK